MTEMGRLVVDQLSVDYLTDAGRVRAVDRVSFEIAPGELFGLCGESGSGKSSLALALPRLLPPPAVVTGGRVLLDDRDLLALSPGELQKVRGRQLALVPQSGMSALNPLLRVEAQILDGLRAHERVGRRTAREHARELLTLVGLPEEVAGAYPHELSGGMRQRAVIAIALAARPSLLILDEATSALDVVTQRQLCLRLATLAGELGFSILFISHDLPLLLALASRVGILYGGRLVEVASSSALRARPLHPYAAALFDCFLDPRGHAEVGSTSGIPGLPPDLRQLPPGCAFHPRCPAAFDRCKREEPLLLERPGSRQVACHLEGDA